LNFEPFFNKEPAMTTTTATKTWSPTDRERMIYRWVKFDGHKQSWVAQQLDMHQSTVSRIVDRYERWIAHGGASQNGAPSRAERLRAQRWLTYERNEWILASCMRLAGEMERALDTSRSTTTHHAIDPTRELEVRTEHKVLDRSGTAARFLRLAHRVNMDQQKLVEKDDLPELEPLSLDPNEFSDATADSRSGFQYQTPFQQVSADDADSRGAGFQPAESAATSRGAGFQPAQSPDVAVTTPSDTIAATTSSQIPNPQSEIPASPPPPLSPSPPPVACTAPHNPATPASPLTPSPTITSLEITPTKKQNPPAYAVAPNPPKTTNPLAEILNATLHQPQPPIILELPFHIPITP
jgi:transposase